MISKKFLTWKSLFESQNFKNQQEEFVKAQSFLIIPKKMKFQLFDNKRSQLLLPALSSNCCKLTSVEKVS